MGDPRAAAPGKYDLKSGENGHLARANGATGGPYCSPSFPSVCGRQFEPLAGRGGGFGARSCTGAAVVAFWALLQSSGEEKRAVPRPSAAAAEDVAGMAALRPLFSGGGRGALCVLDLELANIYIFSSLC